MHQLEALEMEDQGPEHRAGLAAGLRGAGLCPLRRVLEGVRRRKVEAEAGVGAGAGVRAGAEAGAGAGAEAGAGV